jgi:hypothetical protein
MDGLLWHFQTVWANPRIRQLAEATNTDVLLETMAQTQDAHRQLAQTGNAETTCLFNWLKPEGILALVTAIGHAYGNVE